jgi:hypothetical protein
MGIFLSEVLPTSVSSREPFILPITNLPQHILRLHNDMTNTELKYLKATPEQA